MFSKKPAEAPKTAGRAGTARPMAGKSTFSVIGSDVAIKGDISATVDLHVDGRVEGDISCTSLVQGEGGVIKGAIEAETARLAGHIVGSITARDLVVLQSAKIEGDVHYDTLTIEQGADVEGRFAPRSAQATKAKSAATAPAAGSDEPSLTLAS